MEGEEAASALAGYIHAWKSLVRRMGFRHVFVLVLAMNGSVQGLDVFEDEVIQKAPGTTLALAGVFMVTIANIGDHPSPRET